MKFSKFITGVLLAIGASSVLAAPPLVLDGYADTAGAITVLHGGDAVDPYFAMQALLLAHDNGFDVSDQAQRFAQWLAPRQKPDGTFDRFCRTASKDWLACKTADADDALLAMWMRLLDTIPVALKHDLALQRSYLVSEASLAHLYQPSRGVYMVSPVYLHGLLMDNLEVWSFKQQSPQIAQRAEAAALTRAIQSTFWVPVDRRYLVSTQLEQRSVQAAFYPDQVAQVFPLLVDFPVPSARKVYADWMREHRAAWLAQGKTDYPWGIIAVLALRQGDEASVRCWLRESAGLRHSARWAVTDEVSMQVVLAKGLKAASADAVCA